MNKHLKEFLHRGLMFGGFGPIIMAIIYLILSYSVDGFSLSGAEVFIATVSIYLLAFVHAGASIFNQMEDWPIAKSLFVHLLTLYVAYTGCYLVNSWIPFDPMFLLIFTACFVALYMVIWLVVFLAVKTLGKNLNSKLKN